MNCCNKKKKEYTKTVEMTFHREALLYDIKNYAYIEGHVMGEENQHAQHTLVDIGEEGNVDRVTRVLDLAFAECIEFCYPYSKVPVNERNQICDVLDDGSEGYVMDLKVPDDFSQTTVLLLERMIHEYMVCKVLWDWLSITNPEAATGWAVRVEAARESVKDTLNARIGRVRKTQTPF